MGKKIQLQKPLAGGKAVRHKFHVSKYDTHQENESNKLTKREPKSSTSAV